MRKLALALIAGTSFVSATAANAAINFSGSSQGCFNAACSPASTAMDDGLTFTGGTFNLFDSAGFVGLGGTTNNLGVFSLSTASADYTGDLFTLVVNFVTPSGTSPSAGNFSAVLQGNVSDLPGGGVYINFDNTPEIFTFDNGGSFKFWVNDVSLSPGGANQVMNGTINVLTRPLPEPGTWALMILGFGAIGLTMRRRGRRTTLAQIA